MKIHKKILIGIIVVITIISMMAFYAPIRIRVRDDQVNVPVELVQEKQEEGGEGEQSATSSAVADTKTESSDIFLEDMSGFSDLNQEKDLLEDFLGDASMEEFDKVFEEINQ